MLWNLRARDFVLRQPHPRGGGALWSSRPPKRRGRRRGLRRAGSCGRWRLRADRVTAGRFLADTLFPRLWSELGCSCPPGPRVLISAQAEASSSQAAVSTGTRTRAPPARPGCAAHTRAPRREPPPLPLPEMTSCTPVPVPGTPLRRDALCCPASLPSGCLVSFSSGTVH